MVNSDLVDKTTVSVKSKHAPPPPSHHGAFACLAYPRGGAFWSKPLPGSGAFELDWSQTAVFWIFSADAMSHHGDHARINKTIRTCLWQMQYIPTQSTIQQHLHTRLLFLRPKINVQNINNPSAVWDHFKKGKDDSWRWAMSTTAAESQKDTWLPHQHTEVITDIIPVTVTTQSIAGGDGEIYQNPNNWWRWLPFDVVEICLQLPFA